MSEIVEFDDVAIEELKQGNWITITFDDLVCKVIPYTTKEAINNFVEELEIEAGAKEVVFKFKPQKKEE